MRSVTGRNVSNIQMEFQKSPLYSNKQEFSLSRKELSASELENIELLDNLLSLRSKEIDDEFLSRNLSKTIEFVLSFFPPPHNEFSKLESAHTVW